MSFTKIEIEGKKAAPDRIYYNATVVNNTKSTTQLATDPAVVFQDQRQNPLIPDSSNYEVSVQNFTLNGASKTLPLFIPQIQPPEVSNAVTSATVVLPLIGSQYNGLEYAYVNTFSIGQTINKITGFSIYSFFNFDQPRQIIACTTNSFTVSDYTLSSVVGDVEAGFGTLAYYQDPTDFSTTIYTVSFGVYDGIAPTIITEPIIWVPENQTSYTLVPTTALPTQLESDYYYCYTYTHWVQLVNTALNKAWTTAGGGGGTFGTQCPWFEFDESTGLFSINQDSKTCMTPVGNATPLPYPYNVSYTAAGDYNTGEYSFVGMNTSLESLLSNFNSIYYSAGKKWAGSGVFLSEVVIDMGLPINLLTGGANTNSPVGVSLRSQPKTSIFQLANPFDYTPITTATFVRLIQDFISTGGNWSPIASFVLGTSQVPVRNESSVNPISFGQANVGSGSSSGTFQKVLIEASINALRSDLLKGFVLYEPLIETFSSLDPSHHGVSDIDISLYWRNRLTNALIPVLIPNQASVSFRLLFKKKLSI